MKKEQLEGGFQETKNIFRFNIGHYFHKTNIQNPTTHRICMWKFYINLVWGIIYIYIHTHTYVHIYICIHTYIKIHLCIEPSLKSSLSIHTDHHLWRYSKPKWTRPSVTCLSWPRFKWGVGSETSRSSFLLGRESRCSPSVSIALTPMLLHFCPFFFFFCKRNRMPTWKTSFNFSPDKQTTENGTRWLQEKMRIL